MSYASHNDPCPCGSGKKYKKCCLHKDEVTRAGREAPSGSFTPEERASAIRKLLAYAAGPDFEMDVEIAMAIFWGSCMDDRSDEEIKNILRLPQSEIHFNTWLLFDMDVEDGKTVADFFLAGKPASLSYGERSYIEKARQSHFRLYEVEEVAVDSGFRLRDLWTGNSYQVWEKAATHHFVKWDLIATRLMDLGEGYWVIDAGVFDYPPGEEAYLMDALKREHRRFGRNLPGQDETAFFKRIGFLFNHWWLRRVAFPPLPEFVTAEGDQVVFTRVIFDCTERENVIAALGACPGVERMEEGVYSWFEDTPDLCRSLGTIKLQRNRLVLETTSRERGERGRRLLEEAAGRSILYRLSDHRTPSQMIKFPSKSVESATETIPPEVQSKLAKQFLDKHYRHWLDDEIPALSNKTPRHAVTLRTYRPKVIDLLKQFENTEARAAAHGSVPYDFGWLWKELGLERERPE